MTIQATICAILHSNKILLQKKSEGRFGEGKWNGVGGKLKIEETPIKGIIREVYEETGLIIKNPRYHGVLKHYFGDRKIPAWSVHIFSVAEFEREPIGSEEGELKWFPINEIPYSEMWADDKHWLPLLLDGRDFEGAFYFDEDAIELLDFSVEIK